jgi:molybdopterin converting factor small subunit
MPGTVSIHLLAFGRYGELLGGDRHMISVPAGATAGEVLDAVRKLPGGSSLPRQVVVAVNAKQAVPGLQVCEGDVVALLPPMAGG